MIYNEEKMPNDNNTIQGYPKPARDNVYIASSLNNSQIAKEVSDFLENKGFHIPCKWWEKIVLNSEGSVEDESRQAPLEIAIEERDTIKTCNWFVFIPPGRRGSHVELGMAIALGKPIVLLDLYEAVEEIPFYTLVTERCQTKEDLYNWMCSFKEILFMETNNTTINANSSLQEIQDFSHDLAKSKGFWDNHIEVGTLIALVHAELSEALEASRDGNPPSDKINCSHLEEELADVIIRVLDLAEGCSLDVPDAVVKKLKYNQTRPYKHNKQF